KRGPGLRKMLQRHVHFVVNIMEHRMPVAECPALHILAGQANSSAISENRGKGQGLGLPPINTTFFTECICPSLKQTSQFRMGLKTLRPRQQLSVVLLQLFSR